MPNRDSQPVGGGPSRRATTGDPHRRDTPRVAATHDAQASPTPGESKYAAAASNEPTFEPLTVRVELVVVNGPAGKELLKKQAAVVREALQWFADHRLDEHGQEPDVEPPPDPRRSPPPADRRPPNTRMDDSHDDT